MNIFNRLKHDVIEIGMQIYPNQSVLELANIEIPKDNLHGDVSTNIAMIIASKENKNPKEIAIKFKEKLSSLPYIATIEIAGSGFINFILKAEIWHGAVYDILKDPDKFFSVNIGANKSVNIEYVSANPTGPMHIGHARGAVYGDALAKLLSKTGYKVTKEYYVNDAGAQIVALAKTAFLRYKEVLTGEKIALEDGFYPGEYLINVGVKLVDKFSDKLLHMDWQESYEIIKDFVVQEMLNLIKADLRDLGIEHDVFLYEQSLHDSGEVENVIEFLTNINMIYDGELEAPKGKLDENWIPRSQQLFKSTSFGDVQDRPIKKSDCSWTYLASDLAYAKNKIDRKFDHLIYVLGADHSGYIKRIEAIVKALSSEVTIDVKICQLVNFVENDIPIKMSKRSGSFTTVKEVTDLLGKDIIRFMMLTRKNDAILDFDLEKVTHQSKENIVFYVQYAFVRTLSILSKASDLLKDDYQKFLDDEYDLSLLSLEEEIDLMKLLASWPRILESAAKHFEPHRIAFYIINIAAKFHSMWNLGKENNDYRFVIEDNVPLTLARLALVKAIQKILYEGFDIIGVSHLTKM